MDNKITSEEGKISLEAGFIEGDVLLVLASGDLHLPLRFSGLMRTSLTRPWDFKPLDLNRVKYDISGNKMTVEGSSDKFEACAEFEFKEDRLHCECRWKALDNLKDAGVAFVIEIEHDMSTERVTLPMCLYNGNPSLNKETIAPRFPKAAGASFVEEETRFPIPCANLEWKEDGKSRYISLFSMPKEQEWTLGFHRTSKDDLCVMSASGSVSFNGEKDTIYGAKNSSVKKESGYNEFKKGSIITKSFTVKFDEPEQTGWGFRDIVSTGYKLFNPKVKPALALDEVLELKTAALDERWNEDKNAPGFLCVAPDNIYLRPPYYLWGWTGQSFKMALCSAREGFEKNKPELIERAKKCAEFFLKGSKTKTKGLHYNHYYVNDKTWKGEEYFKEDRLSSRALGETFWGFSKLILLFREKKEEIPTAWVEALSDAADFFMDKGSLLPEGIPPLMWFGSGKPVSNEVSSAGTACVCAILGAYKVTNEMKYLKAAEKMAEEYWKIGGNRLDTPFSKATLDAGCEDKEAAVPFFISAGDLYEITKDKKYKVWAEVSGDWLLTWIYFWDVKFRKESILEHYGFRSTGWPSVSIENQHLDVFFPAYEMYEFGKKNKNKLFEHMGKAVFEACSYGISKGKGDWFFDKPGRQGEQFIHTNWGFTPPVGKYPEKFKEHFRKFGITGEKLGSDIWNGGYNPWDTSWIIVMVLEAAQNFKYNQKCS